MKPFENKTKRTTFFIAGFLILAAIILSIGYLYYRYAVKSYRVQVDGQLSAIADMKVKEIIEWREERFGDVSIFYKNALFSTLVKRYFEKPDDVENKKHIQIWLGKVQKNYDYHRVFLMDENGVERFSIPKATTPIASVISRQHSEIMKSKQIIFEDFYRNEHDNKIYLTVLAPIIDAQDSSRVLGILGLQINPEHYLYPFISSWSTPSKTSETLILRREGNEVVFLNDLKFQKDAALNLRAPMNGTKAIPAIRAALGEEGIVEALDYRGVPVIAAIRTIHGSPWFMVTRMDQTEAYAPLNQRLSLLAIPITGLLIGIGIGFILLWKLQRMRFYREKFETSKKLQESEKQFRLLFDTIPDAIFIHDLEGCLLQVNKVACERLGYCKEDLLKMTVKEIDSPEFAAKIHANINKLLETGQIVIESAHVRQDGTVIPVEISSRIIEYADKPTVLSVARDITERKQKEEQLIIQSTALNAAANAIVITDITGKIEWINPAFTKLTGYTLDEVTGENPRTIKSGKHDAAFYRNLWDTILAGKVWHGEMINKRKDGNEYIEEMTITPLKDGNGEIIRFIAVKQDITERKQAAEEIEKLQQQIDYIFGATKTGLNIVDIDYNLYYVSKALQKMYGNYSGRKCYEYFKGTNEACPECLIRKSIETESSVVYESIFPFENNRPVQITTIPFKDNEGKWLAAEVSVDITERKKIEEELSIAKAEAERANIAKSEFLSRMSHELRTPMNSILGFAQLMDMGELKPAHKKGVDHILKSGKHLLDLINEVLDIAKIEAGHISLSIEPIEICHIMKEVKDVVGPLAEGNQITLEINPGNNLFVKTDRQRLKQVLLNLISNAIKYNRENGNVKINCESKVDAETQDSTVRISIADTGVGIAPEDIKKLFNPFERIGAEKTGTEGTGLGLTVVKKLVEAIGGTIGLESKVGVGSTFWVELPQAEGQLNHHERLTDQTKPEPVEAVLTGTLLYIEDNFSNMQLVEHILEEHRPGIRLITEMYGKNAVKLATDYQPGLILLDLDLPDIHGSDVLTLLQKNERTKSIPVVIISADAMGSQIEKLMQAGAKNYLTKPLDVIEFLRVVDEVMPAPF